MFILVIFVLYSNSYITFECDQKAKTSEICGGQLFFLDLWFMINITVSRMFICHWHGRQKDGLPGFAHNLNYLWSDHAGCIDRPQTQGHTPVCTKCLKKKGKKRKRLKSIPNSPTRVSFSGYVSAIWSSASTQAHIRLATWAPCRIHDGCHGTHIATGYTCTDCCLRSTQQQKVGWGGQDGG